MCNHRSETFIVHHASVPQNGTTKIGSKGQDNSHVDSVPSDRDNSHVDSVPSDRENFSFDDLSKRRSRVSASRVRSRILSNDQALAYYQHSSPIAEREIYSRTTQRVNQSPPGFFHHDRLQRVVSRAKELQRRHQRLLASINNMVRIYNNMIAAQSPLPDMSAIIDSIDQQTNQISNTLSELKHSTHQFVQEPNVERLQDRNLPRLFGSSQTSSIIQNMAKQMTSLPQFRFSPGHCSHCQKKYLKVFTITSYPSFSLYTCTTLFTKQR